MTVAELAGQAVGTWAGHFVDHQTVDDVERMVRSHGLGAVATFGWNGASDVLLEDVIETVNRLQRTAIEESRLGIPLLFSVDAVHGHAYVENATVFPNGLGAAATWDPALVERSASMTGSEMRATGAVHNYAPVADVARDPRWGRTFETFGESPFLVSEMTAAAVRGYQSGSARGGPVAATAKHFPAYGGSIAAEDAAPADISRDSLQNVYLAPFRRAIAEGVEAIMPAYSSVEGHPPHGSRWILQDLLREQLGFDGAVVSDWGGVDHLHKDHFTTSDARDSVVRTRRAGMDVESTGGADHADRLVALVEAGVLDVETLRASAERVLRWKVEYGLFEDPFVEAWHADQIVGHADHHAHAREMATQSLTCLENDGILPVAPTADVLVTGPNADDPVAQLGGWSVTDPDHTDAVTVRAAFESSHEGSVEFVPGASVTDRVDVDAAARAAADADVAVVVLGEDWYIHEFGMEVITGRATGEFPTRTHLELPEAQRALLEAVAATDTPTVAVVVGGRPLILDREADLADALLWAYYPGSDGGPAIRAALTGETSPGGRLPITIPRSLGQIPITADRLARPRPIGDDEHYPDYDPLYTLGDGQTYTTFETESVGVSPETVGPRGTITVEATVHNVGTRRGSELIRVEGSDRASDRVTPVRELVGFDRVTLGPGESETVSIDVPIARLARYDAEGHREVAPGEYVLAVGDHQRRVTVERQYH
ncbi:glycosyl hydrolase [Halococcoides cellulosivorans]|uniref:beta-glucosidase n=2 Tax=Halococcoides cellulosivorans TaxID=1679096 RepID=A0A2R4X4B7_9EURY|nr:glycosyl hydrolase [Halococcoides cellulosivorans]